MTRRSPKKRRKKRTWERKMLDELKQMELEDIVDSLEKSRLLKAGIGRITLDLSKFQPRPMAVGSVK